MTRDLLRGAPGYWRNETSGVLRPVVEKYLHARRQLTPEEIGIMRAYLLQWVCAPVWRDNPYLEGEGAAELEKLQASARAIRTVYDIERWLHAAIDLGMDPL